MADIELVIKISEDSYKATCNGWMLPPDVENVVQGIKNGKVLPKGHKELIDTKELIQGFVKAEENMKDNGVTPVFDVHEITNMILSQNVIIEADKRDGD